MKKFLGVVIAVCAAVALTGIPSAQAAKPPVRGDLRCTVASASVHLDPPVLYFVDRQLPPSARHGSSHVSFMSQVSACRGASDSSPAPAGIDHGVVELRGSVKHHDCSNLNSMRLTVKLQLFDASGALVGRHNASTQTTVVTQDPMSSFPMWTMVFAGTMRPPGGRLFGGEPVTMTGVTSGGAVMHICQSSVLDSLDLHDVTLSVGNPS
jgi:hypothetical protein